MTPAPTRRPSPLDRLSAADRFALLAVGAWLAWVMAAALLSGRPMSIGTPYVVAPLVTVAGVACGRLLAARFHTWPVVETLTVAAVAFVLMVPIYFNARAAVGVQLAALGGLAALASRGGGARKPAGEPGTGPRHWVAMVLAVGVMTIGVVLALLSDAATVLIAPLLGCAAWAIGRRSGPKPAIAIGVAAILVVSAATTGIWLAGRDSWLSAATIGLGSARHHLWNDALALWARHPVTGSGPGSFLDASPLTADPDTVTVHSSILQVGSELGVMGVILFAALLAAGFALAARGSQPAALIAVAAWAALGVHSFVDHLFEFPAVTLTAGVVLGWASVTPSGFGPRGPSKRAATT